MTISPKLHVIGSCQHTISYRCSPPEINDVVYCRRCAEYVVVVKYTDAYRIKCRNCVRGAYTGTSEAEAVRLAGKHVMRVPEHVVDVWLGDDIVTSIGHEGQMELPLQRQIVTRITQSQLAAQELWDIVKRHSSQG